MSETDNNNELLLEQIMRAVRALVINLRTPAQIHEVVEQNQQNLEAAPSPNQENVQGVCGLDQKDEINTEQNQQRNENVCGSSNVLATTAVLPASPPKHYKEFLPVLRERAANLLDSNKMLLAETGLLRALSWNELSGKEIYSRVHAKTWCAGAVWYADPTLTKQAVLDAFGIEKKTLEDIDEKVFELVRNSNS
uniref:Uncharacterized protein n=1 Tax=Ditylenchus dipsaci TaxID=166011 RepID=A0A915CWN3_9BILA